MLLLLFYIKCALINTMKNIRVLFSSALTSTTVALLNASTSMAQLRGVRSGVEAAHTPDQPTDLFGDGAIFSTAVDLMLYIVGAIAVVMIIFGGFRYIISGGNAASVTTAKNTILYAIVGVVIALLAYAIIDFILNSLEAGGGTTGL